MIKLEGRCERVKSLEPEDVLLLLFSLKNVECCFLLQHNLKWCAVTWLENCLMVHSENLLYNFFQFVF